MGLDKDDVGGEVAEALGSQLVDDIYSVSMILFIRIQQCQISGRINKDAALP